MRDKLRKDIFDLLFCQALSEDNPANYLSSWKNGFTAIVSKNLKVSDLTPAPNDKPILDLIVEFDDNREILTIINEIICLFGYISD